MTTRPALLAAALSLAPIAALGADVWVAGASEKIRPDAAPRAAREAQIAAARNEFESFQIVVTGPARNVTAQVSPPASGANVLADVKLYRVDTIDVSSPSAVDGGTGRWPDALVPDVDDVVGEKRNAFPFDVGAGESRAIWVEVRVPPDAQPGSYQGGVAVSYEGGSASVPMNVQVWGFVLPSTSSLRTHFGLGYGYLEAGHGVAGDESSAVRARYQQLGLDHRISISGTDDGRNGDWNHFDRFYGPLIAGTAPTRLPGARLTAVQYIGDLLNVDAQRQWADHARRNGWFDRLFQYTCDEPPLTCQWSDIPGRTAAAKQADPNFRTLLTTQIWEADAHGVSGGIDIMVPVVNWMDDKPGSPNAGDQRYRYDDFLRSGANKEVWLYESCMSHGCGGTVNIGSPSEEDRYFTGWPTYMIDASAVRNRAMEWISYLERATGELYWETTFAFNHDAWSNQWDFSGNGDGTLFYPGTPSRIGGQTHIPVASIRLKMIREGMEDYEYLKLLEAAGGGVEARDIARKLFPSAHETEQSPEALMSARQALANAITLRGGGVLAGGGVGAGGGGAGGGCGSAGGFGDGALLALPVLLAAVVLRRLGRRRARR